MNKLNREFNGKIQTYSELDYPWARISFDTLEKGVSYYLGKITQLIQENVLHVLPYPWIEGRWVETVLVNWFLNNYKSLGFDEVILEKTDKYYKLKKELSFEKYPDLVVSFNDEWLRLEVETWAHRYLYCHGSGYADMVLAYDDYYPRYVPDVPTITLKEFFGVDYIISKAEIPHFLYLFDDEFKLDYSKSCTREMACKLGIKELPW